MASEMKCPFDDPLSREFLEDPYPSLQLARDEFPVHYISKYGVWLVTRYDDVKAILRDDTTFTNATAHLPFFPFAEQTARYLKERNYTPSLPLTGSDGALHKRLREKVGKALAFTPRNLAEIKRAVDEEAVKIVSALPRESPFDIVNTLTSLFPARVIYRLIGFPDEMIGQLLVWSSDRVKIFWSASTVDEQRSMAEGLCAYWDYCKVFVSDNVENPQDNITGNLIRLHQEAPDSLSLNEVTTVVFGLVFAGQETTSNATAQTIYMLLKEPSRWMRLVRDQSLIGKAFNETLRLTPPVAAWRRYVTRDVEMAGQAIPAGSTLLLHLGSTGHDQNKFLDADNFDLDRPDGNDHLAFSVGVHFCLGAPLARLEAISLIGALLNAEPHLKLMENQEIAVTPNFAFRGPKSVFVRRV
jgi:cytochrome P450